MTEHIMAIVLAIIGGLTAIVAALTLLVKGINYLIRASSLVANTIWELKRYRFKRIKKNGDLPLID